MTGPARLAPALTNNEGGFEFTALVPATYTLDAESSQLQEVRA